MLQYHFLFPTLKQSSFKFYILNLLTRIQKTHNFRSLIFHQSKGGITHCNNFLTCPRAQQGKVILQTSLCSDKIFLQRVYINLGFSSTQCLVCYGFLCVIQNILGYYKGIVKLWFDTLCSFSIVCFRNSLNLRTISDHTNSQFLSFRFYSNPVYLKRVKY